MQVLHLFRLGKIPGLRSLHPWMNPTKNSMSYLPISYRREQPRSLAVNEEMTGAHQEILPPQIVHDFIDRANYHVIMDKCGCRLARECKHFTHEVGCLFMGETAARLPHGVSRKVTREDAHRHVDRAVGVGLVPMVGKVRVDNFIFLTPDRGKLLSVCFCCHCCCMMGALKHIPAKHLDQVMTPLEGVRVEVTGACVGCGKCVETCIFDAIAVENGKAVHSAQCRACGRCVTYCPEGAVKISIQNPETFARQAEQRIGAYVDISYGGSPQERPDRPAGNAAQPERA
jgi:UDP-glucose 4-epimerase